MPIQKIGFVNGLDKDSDLRYLQNAYRDAFNVRITDYAGGNSLAITNVKGNTEKTYTLPTGHNYVIGSYDDKLNKNVYYFVYNSEDSHSILKYDYTNNVVEKVLEGDLEFSLAYFIDSVALLDNRFLIYTDDNTEPRWVDLDNLSKYSDPVVVPSLLDIAKPPQEIPCYANYTNNSSKKYNNLIGKFWQFRTVYVYKDGTRSAFSTISETPIPAIDTRAPYADGQSVSLENEIIVTIPRPSEDVEEVEFYMQGVSDDSEKTTNWYLWNVEKREDLLFNSSAKYGSPFSDFYFANDGTYTLADPLEVAQAQTYIPKKVKALDVLYGNRLGIANFYDGEDISGIELECNLIFTQNPIPTTGVVGTTASYPNTPTSDPSFDVFSGLVYISGATSANGLSVIPTYDTIPIGGIPRAYDEISFTLRLTYNFFDISGLFTGTLTSDFDFLYIVKESDISATTTTSLSNVASGIAGVINATNTTNSSQGGIIGTSSGSNVRVYEGQNINDIGGNTAVTKANIVGSISITNTSQVATIPTLKRDATHEFGIEYSDSKGRRSTVITSGQLKKRTPSYSASTSVMGAVTSQIEIYHTPPSWATSYSIMYSKNLSYDFTLSFVGALTDTGSDDKWELSLSDYVNFRTNNTDSSINYSFVRGDLIQFIYDSAEGFTTPYPFQNLDPIPIDKFDNASSKIEVTLANASAKITSGRDYTFEIRRPKNSASEKLFYEVGHTYPITNGFHTGNTQDQTASLPAIVDLTNVGDYYLVDRPYYADYAATSALTRLAESENYSDYYDSSVTSIGRASVVDDNFKEIHRKTSIVYSQPYIPNTNKNGIATVYDSSIEQYSTSNGSIQRIYQDDRRLFVFQERKVGVIGINQQFLLNGANQTYETDTVLTPIQYYPAEYGIGLNPESFSVYGYRKYFVDTVRGSVLRLSQDGITPISDVNMRGFFNSLFSMIDPQRVRVVYDKNNDELVLMHNEKDFAVNPTTSAETDVSCTIQLSKASFPQLDQLCLYIKSTGESGTEYIQRTSPISSVTSFNSTTWSVGVTFTALNSISYSVQYARKCTYNVITFNEQVGKWISRWNYSPDWMEECGIGMVSFKDGGIWIHDENNTRGSFYGDEYEATITVIANQSPSQPKTFRNVQLESLNIWDSADSGDVTTPEGQSSSIAQANYIKRNNQHFAPMLRDINTANRTDALFNGNPMTSTVLILKLNNSDTTPVKLFSVGVGYFDTNLSNFNG